MPTLESIQSTLQIAENWRKKNQPSWIASCQSSALMGYLSMAVTDHTPENGIAWLESHSVADTLQSYFETLQTLIAEVESGRLPSSVIAGNYHSLVFAQLAWCMEKYTLGESFVHFSERRDVCELSTKFWREYTRAMGSLVRAEPYTAAALPHRGLEKHWSGYLHLIEATTNNRPLIDAQDEIERLFKSRNADKRLKDDAYQIEGTADHPVRWDFRTLGLTNYLRYKAGQLS